uniref:Uncharacterized protein n=2 Tax=Aureoumbra lagunensis TaxID=44058 RepID=A0A7S3JSF9_9STRA|mmetsp:Transcript_3887/g.5436  ORF Transcript_3887/g.5436 Transcript_3887/m.5436 type:complete len:482 (+) Transcript_3887:34-1479(+)
MLGVTFLVFIVSLGIRHQEQRRLQLIKMFAEENSSHKRKKRNGTDGKKAKAKRIGLIQTETGTIANVGWRAISMKSLRAHPRFAALRSAREAMTDRDKNLANAALFRQDTWQWDALHAQRITGSRAAALLGFFSGLAVSELGIPISLRDGNKRNKALAFIHNNDDQFEFDALFDFSAEESAQSDDDVCEWIAGESLSQYILRKEQPQISLGTKDVVSTRLKWGTVQEAVGILAAINHLKNAAFIAESGMCAAEAPSLTALASEWKDTSKTVDAAHACSQLLEKAAAASSSLMKPLNLSLGASPDAFVVYPDGTVEVLEIKSVSPYVKSKHPGRMAVKDRGPHLNIGPWIIPQVMLEIFCAGPLCTGAKLCSVSATKGAAFFTIPRDDRYIKDMLFWLSFALYNDLDHYIVENEKNKANYISFLRRTCQVANSAQGPTMVNNLQRSRHSRAFFHDSPASSPGIATIGVSGDDRFGRRLSVDW